MRRREQRGRGAALENGANPIGFRRERGEHVRCGFGNGLGCEAFAGLAFLGEKHGHVLIEALGTVPGREPRRDLGASPSIGDGLAVLKRLGRRAQ